MGLAAHCQKGGVSSLSDIAGNAGAGSLSGRNASDPPWVHVPRSRVRVAGRQFGIRNAGDLDRHAMVEWQYVCLFLIVTRHQAAPFSVR